MIVNLLLQNFRNHASFCAKTDGKFILISGLNGSGKTSILEAISLFSTSRGGLLGAKTAEQITHGKEAFFVCATANNGIKMVAESRKNGKMIKIENKMIRKASEMNAWCNVMWFTAMMHYELFSHSARRKFFDRLAFFLNHIHGENISVYEKLTKERVDALVAGNWSENWLALMERQIAEQIVAIAQRRLDAVSAINQSAEHGKFLPFGVIIELDGLIESIICQSNAIQLVCNELKQNRQKDSMTATSHFGINKTKVHIYTSTRQEVGALSSGQQKMLFLEMIYAAADVITKTQNRSPIILFDEIVSFLDLQNLTLVMESLQKVTSQVWLTSQSPVLSQLMPQVETVCIDL